MKTLKLIPILGLAGLVACEQDLNTRGTPPVVTQQTPPPTNPITPPINTPPTEPTGPEVPNFDPVGVGMEHGGEVGLTPAPVEPIPANRQRRRMDLDQLDASLRRATGGIGWEINNSNQFETLAATLGKPNFTTTTNEDLDPSAMFQKFLGDAARSACFSLMTSEQAASAGDRVFFRHVNLDDTMGTNPEGIRDNLAYLLLRYHGRSVNALGGELDQWLWLYRSAEHVSNDPIAAWRTVCVGLITHPDFYTY